MHIWQEQRIRLDRGLRLHRVSLLQLFAVAYCRALQMFIIGSTNTRDFHCELQNEVVLEHDQRTSNSTLATIMNDDSEEKRDKTNFQNFCCYATHRVHSADRYVLLKRFSAVVNSRVLCCQRI